MQTHQQIDQRSLTLARVVGALITGEPAVKTLPPEPTPEPARVALDKLAHGR